MKLENLELNQLGTAKRIESTNNTTIVQGGGKKKRYKDESNKYGKPLKPPPRL